MPFNQQLYMEMNNQMPMGIGGFIPEKSDFNVPEGKRILINKKIFIERFII